MKISFTSIAYEELESIAHRNDDRPMALTALMARVTIQAAPTSVHDPTLAIALGEQALVLARELGDRAAETRILWNLSLAYFFGNRPAQARMSRARAVGVLVMTAQGMCRWRRARSVAAASGVTSIESAKSRRCCA